ncbi:AAA family ATPase [Nostocaceae cyanobacterium CENA369]|uniref:AAA family ATPase n=1 Tax=Dendronalium phyllosphericum CENA369 TaxID=1725256 RepID=A0A8J7I553_9NOST|nr:ATP-binding protein [Dendronalium phyllosphericum]MBH8576001.1 AAA family ATPase [Dendronalium phyllosphericum CENA369]
MKVESISIQNFKLFDKLDVSFKNHTLEEVSNQFLVLGDNGTGKTTLLQAIALPLALATGKIQKIESFDWIGFLPERYWKSGTPRIELEVSFENDELEATRQIAQQWFEAQPSEFKKDNRFVEPGNSRSVQLLLTGDYWTTVGKDQQERLQFRGRSYAQWFLNKGEQSVRSQFSKLPGVFWFDQFRNLGSNAHNETSRESRERSGGVSFELGVGQLRQYLIAWRRKQEQGGNTYSNDYLKNLERYYKKIFPERSFWGLEQHIPSIDSPTEENTYFLLSDGHRRYDIVEMSAGEQAVFPILYEFVRQQIAYSVVLIDEIDLNLHPPAAQMLVNQLPKIAPTSQFIFTTHSEAVNDVIGEDETYRLSGGSLCL